MPGKKPDYLEAVEWIATKGEAVNLDPLNIQEQLTVRLISEVFGVPLGKVAADVFSARSRPNHPSRKKSGRKGETIKTKRRHHKPFEGSPGRGTYAVSIWDHEGDRWEQTHSGVSLMALRSIIRRLESEGYSEVSYAVDREASPQEGE